MAARSTWQDKVKQKGQSRDSQIPSDWRLSNEQLAQFSNQGKGARLLEADVPRRSGILSDAELTLTEEYTASDLLRKLSTGQVSSLSVSTAFCKRAAIAQQLTSCLTEIFFQEALDRARFLDDYRQRVGKVIGPLHGLPVSIKDKFCVKGFQSTIGYVSFLDDPPAKANASVVDILMDLGAVLYVKTNVPQTMMTADSHNNVFGRVLNPHNTNLNAGGSSGGEGALVAFRGSILGVGTDVAGSVRVPALCCGVYGFRPTIDRIPFSGAVSGKMEGIPTIKPAAGPLGHTLADLEMFMSTIINAEPWKYDSTTESAGRWENYTVSPSKALTIGVLPPDPDYPVHPPIQRAIETAISTLAEDGHHIVRLSIDPAQGVSYANRLAWQYFSYPPHKDHIAAGSEPPVPSVAKGPSPMFTGSFPVDPNLDTIHKMDQLSQAKDQLRDRWRQTFVSNGLDAVLAPGSQSTAVPHDTYGWPAYTAIWNILDYPGCIIPYGRASKELYPNPMSVMGDVQPDYNPADVDGAPTHIQIITPRLQDEKCLWAARIIESSLR